MCGRRYHVFIKDVQTCRNSSVVEMLKLWGCRIFSRKNYRSWHLCWVCVLHYEGRILKAILKNGVFTTSKLSGAPRFTSPGDQPFPLRERPKKSTKAQVYDARRWCKWEVCFCLNSWAAEKVARKSGCKGTYALRQVPGHDRVLMTPVEPMHLVKNIAEHIVHLISGIKDSRKVWLDEQARGRFSLAWVVPNSRQLPPVPFVPSSSES